MTRLTTVLFASLVTAFSLPALAQAPLKLGLLLDMAGPYADIGGREASQPRAWRSTISAARCWDAR